MRTPGWAFQPGRYGIQGHWFSGDHGQVTSPTWVSVSSCVTAWPIVYTLFHSLPSIRCLLSGEDCSPLRRLTSFRTHKRPIITLTCIFISSPPQLLFSAINTGLCLEHMFARCCRPSLVCSLFLSCLRPGFLSQVVNNYSLHFLTSYSCLLYVLVPTAA